MINTKKHNRIPKIEHSLILLLFISALLIFLDLGLFSASFFFGSFLIINFYHRTSSIPVPSGVMWYLFVFIVIALASIIFSGINITFYHFKIYIQTVYWLLLAVIVYNAYPVINKKSLSKYILFSTLLLLILYVIGFRSGMSQNSVSFSVIILAPLGYFYLNRPWKKFTFAVLLIFLMLLNGSRTGAIISFIQSGFILLFSVPILSRYIKPLVAIIILTIVLFNVEPVRKGLGKVVYPYNNELGMLIKDPELVMRTDKSWLTRKAQVQKGKQIFAKHPVLGIGYMNFVKYDIKINFAGLGIDPKMKGIKNRSAHNSYIEILAETGIIGFTAFFLFFIHCLFIFWKSINHIGNSFESNVFVSLLGMLVYFYTISAYLGTSSWIMYGLFAGATLLINNETKKERHSKQMENPDEYSFG